MATNTIKDDISPFKAAQTMKNDSFELYHYREPYFKSLDFHAHEFYEAYLFLDGNVTYYIEDRVYDLCAGDLLIIPPGQMHRPVIENENSVYERMVLWANQDYISKKTSNNEKIFPSLSSFNQENGYLISLSGDELAFAISLLSRIFGADECYQQSLISTFFSHACECHAVLGIEEEQHQALIPSVIRYLNDNFTRQLTLDEISAEFFISKFHLSRQFKKHTNSTVYNYILQKRVTLARKLIRQGVNASNASEKCGFLDYSMFYKAFKAKTGTTPREFSKSCDK